MTITTKFNPGQDVLIVRDSSIHWATITKVVVEKSAHTQGEPLITYYFEAQGTGRNELYRYESEVAETADDLVLQLAPKSKPPTM